MARKRSSLTKKRKSPRPRAALPPPAPTRKSYMRRWLEQKESGWETEKWAKLELQLGRFAQGASLACGFVLGFTVFIASYLIPNPPPLLNLRRPDMALWFPLLAAGFGVAGFTVAKKLGPYRLGFRSAHFLSSLVAFAVATLALAAALLDHLAVYDLGAFAPWMYPASVLGISLAFVSLALTWEGVGWRKMASLAFSLAVPASLMPVPLLGPPDFRGLMLVFTYDALFIVFAGSLLHLIASSGEATQREILKASDTKISLLKDEMESKLRSIEYKEKAYVEREAHLEAKERDLLDIEKELDGRGKDLNTVQAKLDLQSGQLKQLESRIVKMRAEVEAKVQELTLKEKDSAGARAQLDEARRELGEREKALAERAKEVKRGEIEASSRERSIQGKAAQLAELEERLRTEGQGLDVRREEVIRLQKDLELKESEVKLKLEQLEAQQATETKEKVAQLRDWEAKVLAKEREVGQLEVKLRTVQEEAERRAAEVQAKSVSLEQERGELAGREQELVTKEKQIADLEAAVGEKNKEIERRWKEVLDAQKRVQTREAEYNSMFKDAKLKEADFASTREEVAQKGAALDAREAQISQWRANLESETKKLQQKVRELLAREKSLEAKESDMSLRELEMTTRERDGTGRPAAAPSDDEGKLLEVRWKQLREKEEEWKRRMYQKEKELEARELALREQLRAASPEAEVSEGAAPEVAPEQGDRLPTGTPRLDDLLYGGLPMNANVLFVGPAFVGKEVAILNFVAQGLRTNAPAVIVTTSKPPVEISKEMAPVLPTFMEYENLGLVRWVDASGTTPTPSLARDGNTFRVKSAADFDGILAALNESDEEFRAKGFPYFRFAFLTLSSSLSQTEERTAMGFVQRFVNRLRQSKCVAAFALERGMHTDQQVEGLQQLMDGVLHFKQDKSKTLLSVVGIGEVQTRDWVPYKFTNKALMIGSFQLERIR